VLRNWNSDARREFAYKYFSAALLTASLQSHTPTLSRMNKVARMASIPNLSKHTPHQAALDESTPLLKDKHLDSQTQAASIEEGLKSPHEESSFPPKDLSRVRMVLCIGPLMLCTFFAAMGKRECPHTALLGLPQTLILLCRQYDSGNTLRYYHIFVQIRYCLFLDRYRILDIQCRMSASIWEAY